LPISIFTSCLQPCKEIKGVLGVASFEIFDPFVDRPVQGCPLFDIQVVAAASKHVIDEHKLDHLALGQIGGLVEQEAAVVDVGFERRHRF
jgi:hypothetical protein